MATKTFKIGLSAADKQNMAQDIYERILDLTFPEYDTTASYSVGDFVVYNNQLYKCIGATSGTWDSTKWQLATLNDLVEDIEDAVQFVNDKANVDGNYPTLTAGLADNLTPYSEDSGDTQDNPFISQGTGTNNNNEIVTVGDFGLLREKQGHTLVVNQLVENGDFASTSGWSTYQANISASSNTLNFTATGSYGFVTRLCNIIQGHKYLISVEIKLTTATTDIRVGFKQGNNINTISTTQSTTNWQIIRGIKEAVSADDGVKISDFRTSDWDTVQVKDYYLVDLTQMFNGDIPQDLLSHPENFFRYYQGSLAYNTGTLVNANSERLVSTGRNLWDEEWEQGSINSNGENEPNIARFRSKNFIPVVPNTDYYFYYAKNQTNGARTLYFYWYDKDKNFISGGDEYLNTPIKHSPVNACFLRIRTGGGSPEATYGNDITISLYYTPEQGGEGYDQYYPHEEPTIVDTGSEVLRQAGNIKDYKTPDGVVHRVVANHIFSNTDQIVANSTTSFYIRNVSLPANPKQTGVVNYNIVGTFPFAALFINENGVVRFNTTQEYASADLLKAALVGHSINYEIQAPTEEQGTTFSENLPINDYGMLYWEDSNGVPQGAEIFYPVNYKGFLDDVYNRTSGDAQALVIQSELSANETARDTVDAQLLNAIGGTLRQCLCVKESLSFENTKVIDMGTLAYVKDSDGKFYATLSADSGKILCTKYAQGTYSQWSDGTKDKIVLLVSGSSVLYIRDTEYNSATTFKNAMKGVLLAYEKA